LWPGASIVRVGDRKRSRPTNAIGRSRYALARILQEDTLAGLAPETYLMRDPVSREYVACLITHEALIGRGSTHGPPLGSMQVFDNCRGEIGRAASDGWACGEA
jgi:hypothetical protein